MAYCPLTRKGNKEKEMETMTKADMVTNITVQTGYYEKDVEKVVTALVAVVGKTLVDEGRVQLPGLGTLIVRERPARTARNPRTGEKVEVPASRTVGFKPGKVLKERING